MRLPAQLSSRPRRPCEAAAHQSLSEEDPLARPARGAGARNRVYAEGGRRVGDRKRESEAGEGEQNRPSTTAAENYAHASYHTLPLLHKLPPLLSRTLVANEPALQRSATETLGKHSSANRHLGLCIGELVRQRPRWLMQGP